eukprot:10237565-Lingulodinium_polyedra.AAC.1
MGCRPASAADLWSVCSGADEAEGSQACIEAWADATGGSPARRRPSPHGACPFCGLGEAGSEHLLCWRP